MASGRIRRSARRGIAAAVLGWLGVAVASVALAPGAAAAKAVTIEIKNVTPPAAGVDAGGTVTFVNRVATTKPSVSVPLVGSVTATVTTDVAVTFFGQKRALAPGRSTAWTFPSTTAGSITYTYRVSPQSGLAPAVADQVVDLVKATLPRGGAPVTVPYTVQTIVPQVPNAPSVNVPALPAIEVPEPAAPEVPATPEAPEAPVGGEDPGTPAPGVPDAAAAEGPAPIDADQYTYGSGAAAPGAAATDTAAAAAFDASRFAVPSGSIGSGGGGASAGGGGLPGRYDGASVPVFGQLAGIDGDQLDEEDAGEELATSGSTAQTLPAAALAAVVALASVTAALVRTHQAQRPAKD
jgi:hypothetical protein